MFGENESGRDEKVQIISIPTTAKAIRIPSGMSIALKRHFPAKNIKKKKTINKNKPP